MLPENIQVRTESVQNIANSIRGKNGLTDKYKIGEMSGAIDEMIVAQPNTTKEITENGTYDVSTYTSANVQTPVPTGTTTITSNGTHDVTQYASANVQVPQPSGTISITQNGSYDVEQYRFADVNTPSYIPDSAIAISTNGQHNVGIYEYANVNVKPLLKGNISMSPQTDLTDPDSFYDYVNQFDWSNMNDKSVTFDGSKMVKFKLPTNCKPMYLSVRGISQNDEDYNLETIELFDTTNMTSLSQMFLYRRGIKNVPELDTTNITNLGAMFYMSRTYTYTRFVMSDDSLNNILNMCRKSGVSTNKYLSYLFQNWGYLASADKTTLITRIQGLSNYQSFIDSGWTIEP